MLNRIPNPRGEVRRKLARDRRDAATRLAYDRGQPPQPVNPELQTFTGAWPTNYSKGLPHHPTTGLVAPDAFSRLVDGINSAANHALNTPFDVPIGPATADGHYRPNFYHEEVSALHFNFTKANGDPVKVRNWESPRAGHVFDLLGPDAGALAISAFPKLGSDELNAEMAELFAMAFLRDTDVIELETGAPAADPKVATALTALNKLPWFNSTLPGLSPAEVRRHEARFVEPDNPGQAPGVTAGNLFRGSAPGAKTGPFVSQFLLIGNKARGAGASDVEHGHVEWGAQTIDQRLSVHKEGVDWLTDWPSWLDAQNGANFKGLDQYQPQPRFITTLRDLATYVHFDALYQAYLNAYLILTSLGADFEAGFPSGSAHPTRGSFATFGAPHFQTLLTEVASRALKVVRRQKFQWQLRGRPEYLAGMLAVAGDPALANDLGAAKAKMTTTLTALTGAGVYAFPFPNQTTPPPGLAPNGTYVPTPPAGPNGYKLLPMAFPEGSPMHPSYGAGHATVAGACVTMIKASLRLYRKPETRGTPNPFATPDLADPGWWQDKLTLADLGLPCVYHPPARGAPQTQLVPSPWDPATITVIGELNKLAANISIARNIAGVHYYTDYYASLRLGERVAAGMLEEQLLTYIEPVVMRFESFDGDHILLSTTGDGMTITKQAFDANHNPIEYDSWWSRHFA